MSSEERTGEPREVRPDLTLLCGLLLLVLAVAAAGLGFRAYLGLNDREPLLAGLPAGGAHQRETAPPTRQVRHAVLVIADGLVAELALTLPPLGQLAARGIQGDAEAAWPTFSRASYVTWLAGLDPVDSGVRTNRYRGFYPLDSLPSKARAGGLHVMGYDEDNDTKIGDLFGPHLSTRLSGPESWPQVLRTLRWADLALLALTAPDKAAHQHGISGQQYQEAVQATARRIGDIIAALDLEQDLLVVVNDHGHLPAGGHGGAEPAVRRLFLIAAGAGLARGLKRSIDQKDLAPTLAHLLGLLPPAHNRGWSLGWALDPKVDPSFYEAAFATQYPARHRVDRFLAEELQVTPPEGHGYPRAEDLVRATVGNLDEARRLGWHMLQVLHRRVDQGQAARLKELRVRRGLWLGVPMIAVLVLLAMGARMQLLRVRAGGAFLAVLPLIAVAVLLYLLDIRPTLSQSGPRTWWLARMLAAAGGGALLHLMLAFVLPGRGGPEMMRATRLGRLLVGAWLFSVVALAGITIVPVAPGSALPNGRLVAIALIAWVCWVGYLLLVGLVLALTGLRGRAASSHSFAARGE